jgi:hypothetical protein
VSKELNKNMKLGKINLIVSTITIGIWLVIIGLCFVNLANPIVLSIIGTAIISMWITNGVGIIIGIVSVFTEKNDTTTGLATGIHLIQLITITAVIMAGVLLKISGQ